MSVTRNEEGRITNVPTGCHIDGVHGIHAMGLVCDLAELYGWVPDADYGTTRDAYYNDGLNAEGEFFPEYVDEAEMWLNNNTDGPGTWQWVDGDFGYYVDDETDAV